MWLGLAMKLKRYKWDITNTQWVQKRQYVFLRFFALSGDVLCVCNFPKFDHRFETYRVTLYYLIASIERLRNLIFDSQDSITLESSLLLLRETFWKHSLSTALFIYYLFLLFICYSLVHHLSKQCYPVLASKWLLP